MTESTESRLKTLITVFPVLTAGLYLLGAMHYEGYLTTFGIEQSMFPMPGDRLLLLGFFAFLGIGAPPIAYSVIASFGVLCAVVVTAIFSSVPRVQRWQTSLALWATRRRSKREPSPKVNALVDTISTVNLYAVGSLLILMLLVVAARLSAHSGKEQAEREIADFAAGEIYYVDLSSDQFATPRKARQLICGATYCAFWLGQEAVVLRHDQVNLLVTHNPSLQPTAAGKPASAAELKR